MKPKIQSWKRSPFVNRAMALALAVVAAVLVAHPMPGFASEREADASRSNESPSKMRSKKPQAVKDKPTGTTSPGAETSGASMKREGFGPRCLRCGRRGHIFCVVVQPYTSQLEKGPEAKNPKQTRQTNPVEIQREIQKRKKPAALTKPVKGKDKGFDDQGKVEEKNPSGGKVKVSDIPIIKPADKATAK